MEMFIFARFHIRADSEKTAEEALMKVLGPTREEEGCLNVHAFRSKRDPHIFYIHSRWKSEEAFEIHAGLPHTVNFIETMERLIDQPIDVTRTELLG
jgi:quinol monooxygenase YgiN